MRLTVDSQNKCKHQYITTRLVIESNQQLSLLYICEQNYRTLTSYKIKYSLMWMDFYIHHGRCLVTMFATNVVLRISKQLFTINIHPRPMHSGR